MTGNHSGAGDNPPPARTMHGGAVTIGRYYLVRRGAEWRVEGPCMRWQDACTAAFGCISQEMRVRCMGEDRYWATKRREVAVALNSAEGWFRPFVPGSVLGLTFLASEALGPAEIAERMRGHADRMRSADSEDELRAEWDAANQYLQWIPVSAAAMFSDLHSAMITTLRIRAAAEERQAMHDTGGEG